MKHAALKALLRSTVLTGIAVSLVVTLFACNAMAASKTVILTTTTSTQDSGLLDLLVPMFEKQTGYAVKTVSVGTGQALALGGRGEADVVLVHAPETEKKYLAEGSMVNRRL
ncbi:MAG TPA: substrate-binding domain-containing protein, partial [Candidatus Methylomirabilis sp.]|nr:substrate-binding domain-containing protein [Candidatus Methylomirabilis sp.]